MPKIKSSITNVFNLFSPQIDDPKKFVSNDKELISRPAEDGLVVPVPADDINNYVDPTVIFHQGSSYILHPGTVAGTGIAPARDLPRVVNLSGTARIGKFQAARRGVYSLSPFGFVFSAVGDNYADAQFTGAISDAYPTLSGDPVKAASFIAYEARLTRAVANALNRELDYSSGNSQSVRIAQLWCYERDLLWLQEVVNGVARILGYYEFMNDLSIVDPSLASTGTLNDPEFYSKVNALARIISQFKTIDPDTHTTLQFLNDFKVNEKSYLRQPVVTKDSVHIHVPFSTNGAAVENITNAAPIPMRIATTELNHVKTATGKALHYHDLLTQDWVDAMVYGVTKAKALAALDEIILLAHGMIENYKDVLKYLNTVEGKKIATLNKMSDYLYFDGTNVTPVQPYMSFIANALHNGSPMISNIEGSIPTVFAKCLIDFTTGGTYMTSTRLQSYFLSNFVEWGPGLSEKVDDSQEYFWQIWVPYSVAGEAMSNTTASYRFVNPFNGLIYVPASAAAYITAATSIKATFQGMDMNGTNVVGFAFGITAATKNYPCIYGRSDTGWASGVIVLDLNAALFGAATTDTKQEKHDEMFSQIALQMKLFANRFAYQGSKNTASEVGFLVIKSIPQMDENLLLPISNAYFTVWASKYYADLFPAIDFAKSVGAQK